MIEAYPLSWPDGWKRTSMYDRKNATFSKKERQYRDNSSWNVTRNLTVSDGVSRILESLEKMGVDRQDVIISTNVRTRLDGLPRGGEREPTDPGAAVYWRTTVNAPMRAMAIDRYTIVADNLAAIAATLEAMRAIERHGGAEILDRAFTGFKALAAESVRPSWWDVLGCTPDASAEVIQARYKAEIRSAHPDAPGGSHEASAIINAARDEALAQRAA